MKTKSTLIPILILSILAGYGQKSNLDLTFTAVSNSNYKKLDSIKVMNRSQGGTSTVYYPDTTLSVDITEGDTLLYIGYSHYSLMGVQNIISDPNHFHLFQNYPNPVKDLSTISIYIPKEGDLSIFITDIAGRVIFRTRRDIDEGMHRFSLIPGGDDVYFLTAQWSNQYQTIKILTLEQNEIKKCNLVYQGKDYNQEPKLKMTQYDSSYFQESGILDKPIGGKTYTFQFATNIPCPGMPTVNYEGQVYNTIQIYSQCWMKENLNVGTLIHGEYAQSNNDIIEKYCYGDNLDSCTKYGGLYMWDEMMQYQHGQGVRGICPSGWHIPTDEEWKVLEGSVDSRVGIGDETWEYDMRGFDVAKNLKTNDGWNDTGSGTDLFGFSALPGGVIRNNGQFDLVGINGGWWTSTEIDSLDKWDREISGYYAADAREPLTRTFGLSVRCLKDN
jgi:uncharacterized protein (TIGR02145 family)